MTKVQKRKWKEKSYAVFTMCSTSSIKLEIRNVAAVQSALQRNVPESVQSLLFCLFKLLFLRRSLCRRRCGCLCSVLTHAAHPNVFENEDFLSVLAIRPAFKRGLGTKITGFRKRSLERRFLKTPDYSESCGRTKTEVFKYGDVIHDTESMPTKACKLIRIAMFPKIRQKCPWVSHFGFLCTRLSGSQHRTAPQQG